MSTITREVREKNSWRRMFDSLTNQEVIEQNKRKIRLEKMKKEKKSDTGL